MIMLLTHHSDLREQLNEALQQSGHMVAIPAHREDMLTVLKDSQPDLIILDLYLSHPSGADDLKILREHGYTGRTIVLSAPSMMSVLNEAYASGVDRVVKVPVKINGRYDLGELQSTIQSCIHTPNECRTDHRVIAQRAYELYEAGGRYEGCDFQHWLQAERDVAMR
jgi:DNA-binding response OmpR family regulator